MKGIREQGAKGDEVTGGGRNCIIRGFIVCTLHQILLGSRMK
jgi:hypothetical protein